MVKEAVNNAIKHAGATAITIKCSVTGQLQFFITDNGKGFNPDTIKSNGNGLANYKKRVEKSGGTYQVITSPEQGTTILFHIPVNPTG